MRGSLAAACAAVLLGLSPAGGLPFASFAASAAARVESVCALLDSPRAPVPNEGADAVAFGAVVSQFAVTFRTPVVFASPSGPAPSQAPPAA